MNAPTNVSVRCGCCGTIVLLRDFTLNNEHCDDCEFAISRDMQQQSDLDEADAEAMAYYYGEAR